MVAATRRTKARRDTKKTTRAGQEVCLKTRVRPPTAHHHNQQHQQHLSYLASVFSTPTRGRQIFIESWSGMARRRRIVASMDGGAADSSSTSPSRRVCKHSARNLGASLKMRSGLCSRERACVRVVRATPWHPVRPHGHNNIIGCSIHLQQQCDVKSAS